MGINIGGKPIHKLPSISSANLTGNELLPLDKQDINGSWSNRYTTIDDILALVNSLSGTGTIGYIPKFTATTAIGNSNLFINGTSLGINTTSPNGYLDVSSGSTSYFRVATNSRTFWQSKLAVNTDGSIWFNPTSSADAAIYNYDSVFSNSVGTYRGKMGWVSSATSLLTTGDLLLQNSYSSTVIIQGFADNTGMFIMKGLGASGDGTHWIGGGTSVSNRQFLGTLTVQCDGDSGGSAATTNIVTNRNSGSTSLYLYNKTNSSTLNIMGGITSQSYNAGSGDKNYIKLLSGADSNGLIVETVGANPLYVRTNSVNRISITGAGTINITSLQTGNGGLSTGDLYKDTAANILANGDKIVAIKA